MFSYPSGEHSLHVFHLDLMILKEQGPSLESVQPALEAFAGCMTGIPTRSEI